LQREHRLPDVVLVLPDDVGIDPGAFLGPKLEQNADALAALERDPADEQGAAR
jgi:hypothetical protein